MTSTEKPSRPRRPRTAAAPKRLSVDDRLLAGMERLLEQGQQFGALTVEQLAEEAGIARATFYLHFRDKGELVRRLMQRLTSEVIDSAGTWFRGDREVDRHTMHFALHGIVRTFKKHQAILCAISATADSDPEVAKLHAEMMDELTRMSRRAITRVRRDGRGAPGTPPELADLLTWFIELYCARFLSNYEGRKLDKLIDAFAFICGNAIFAAGD
jgi:AcrR family transcriptional regulator